MLLCSNELFVDRSWECHPKGLSGTLKHWRFRAEEARTIGDQMTDEEARTIMRHIAMDYDRLAKLAEEQIADQERGTIEANTGRPMRPSGASGRSHDRHS